MTLKMTSNTIYSHRNMIMFTVPKLVTNSDEIQLRRSCCKINEGVFWRRRCFCIKICMAPTSQIMPHLKFEKINRPRSLKTLMLNLRVVQIFFLPPTCVCGLFIWWGCKMAKFYVTNCWFFKWDNSKLWSRGDYWSTFSPQTEMKIWSEIFLCAGLN